MTYTPIPAGTLNWDVPVNAAFTDQDGRITTNESAIATLGPVVSSNTTRATALENANTGLNSAAALGYLGWTYDPTTVGTGQQGTAGTMYLSRINVGVSATATKLIWGNNTAGASPVAGQNFVALYDSAGNRLANVGVDGRVASTGIFAETINASVSPGFYWVAFLFNATTMPSVYRGGFLNGTLVNGVLAPDTMRFGTNGTGRTTTPATITPSSNSYGQHTFYAALTV